MLAELGLEEAARAADGGVLQEAHAPVPEAEEQGPRHCCPAAQDPPTKTVSSADAAMATTGQGPRPCCHAAQAPTAAGGSSEGGAAPALAQGPHPSCHAAQSLGLACAASAAASGPTTHGHHGAGQGHETQPGQRAGAGPSASGGASSNELRAAEAQQGEQCCRGRSGGGRGTKSCSESGSSSSSSDEEAQEVLLRVVSEASMVQPGQRAVCSMPVDMNGLQESVERLAELLRRR